VLGLKDGLGEKDGLREAEGLKLRLALGLKLRLALGDKDADGEIEADSLALGDKDADGLRDAEGDATMMLPTIRACVAMFGCIWVRSTVTSSALA
jgi:hypothetical protein